MSAATLPLVLGALSVLGRLAPPPWNLIALAVPKLLPLIAEGKSAVAAINTAAPELWPHIHELAATAFRGAPSATVATALFAPHRLTPDEQQRMWDRASGGGLSGGAP